MTTRERLAIAALASLVVHGFVISGDWLPLPQTPGEPRPMLARLAPSEPPLVVAKPRIRAPRTAAPAPAPPVPTVSAASPIVFPEMEPDAAPAEDMAPEPAAPEPPQQLAMAAPASVVAPIHTLPRRGRISYTLLYGPDRAFIGRGVQTWEVKDDSYILSSEAETGGVLDLFRPQRLHSISRGAITAEGLRPESFLTSRTRRGRTAASRARFDWDAGKLTYGSASEEKTASLAPGAQDLMSFMFQFVLLPPAPGRYQLPIATGTRFETYGFEIRPEEPIETPIGTMRALPVRQLPRAGAESIEMWLAAEYRYLPVRIRHYDREGHFAGEQLVNEIRISEE
jgi:Protein of unknown function (DUF3108)